jgi:chromosome segregation ATPase
MSVAKVETVKASRKDQGKCEKCGTELPQGTGYRYFYVGFRSKFKHVRCMKAECAPRQSERESSKVATWYAAQETFEDQIDTLDTKDDVENAVQEAGAAARELADEYREAADAWESGNEQLEEKADHWESQADEIENWTFEGDEEPERCNDCENDDMHPGPEGCSGCAEKRDEWLEELREAAREAVNNVETI